MPLPLRPCWVHGCADPSPSLQPVPMPGSPQTTGRSQPRTAEGLGLTAPASISRGYSPHTQQEASAPPCPPMPQDGSAAPGCKPPPHHPTAAACLGREGDRGSALLLISSKQNHLS